MDKEIIVRLHSSFEEMIKLPIRLRTYPQWKEAVKEALAMQAERSKDRCLFVMPKGKDWSAIEATFCR